MIDQETAIKYATSKREHAVRAFDARTKIAELEESIKMIEQSIMVDIANAVDGAGKALYSNAEKRQAQLAIECADRTDFHTLQADLLRAKDEAARADIEKCFMDDMVKISLAFAQE
jgi:hypothetical protein